MYKPIAENDTESICALMNYYKKVYRVIGSIVLIVGVSLMPFLRYLINGECPKDINLSILYLLFLGNTVVSYFMFAYKTCILTAHQREDIISKVNIVLKLGMYFIQTISLIVFKSYYGYIICTILNTIFTNSITAFYSNKYYPQYQCKEIYRYKEN